MENMFSRVKNEIEELRTLKTPYQIAKEMNISKATLYRLFDDEGMNKVKFETVVKIMNYRNKTLSEQKTVFEYRDERVYLINQLIQQPILWTGKVVSELFDYQKLSQEVLRQPDLTLTAISYAIYQFVPNASEKSFAFNEKSEYLAETIHEMNELDNGNVQIKFGAVVVDLETKEEVIKDFVLDVTVDKGIAKYSDEINRVIYYIKLLMTSYLEEKSQILVGYKYYVTYPLDLGGPVNKLRKELPIQIGEFQFEESLYKEAEDIMYDLEKLVTGKPYAASVSEILLKKKGIYNEDEVIPLEGVLELHEYDNEYLLFFKTYILGEVNTTQLIHKTSELDTVISKMESIAKVIDDVYAYVWDVEEYALFGTEYKSFL